MARKNATRRAAKKKNKGTVKTRAQQRRTKKLSKPKPRRRTQPGSKAVLSGGIYAGDPTGGHIGDKTPAE